MSLDPLGTVDDPIFPRRSRVVPIVIALVVLAGIGAGVWFLFFTTKTTPNRVFFAVATETSDGKRGAWWAARGKASARLADGLEGIFKDLGLVAVAPGDPKTLSVLEELGGPDDLGTAARKLSAGLMVVGAVRIAAANALGESKDKEYGLDIDVSVVSTDEGATPVRLLDPPLRFWSVGADEEAALLRAADWLPRVLASRLAERIAGLDVLASYAPGASRSGSQADIMAGKLEPLFKLAARRKDLLAEREREAAQVAEGFADLDKSAGVLGGWLDEEYFIGSGPDGGVLLMELQREPEVRATEEQYHLQTGHERLLLAGADGKSRRVVFDTYNFFSYPTASRDGTKVAAVLDRLGRSNALVTISVPDGAVTVLVEHKKDELSGPNMAPDGSAVAFWRKACRRGCPSKLYVVPAAGGEPRQVLDGEWDYMGYPAWSPDAKTLYMTLRASEGDDDRVSAINLAPNGSTTRLLPADDGTSSYQDLAISPTGAFLVVVERAEDGRFLGRYDLATGQYTRLASGRLSDPKVSGDGATVAFQSWEDGGDSEIAVVPAAGGNKRLLTRNDDDDKLAGWSRDGKRLFVHRGSRDPDGDAWDNRVVWIAP